MRVTWGQTYTYELRAYTNGDADINDNVRARETVSVTVPGCAGTTRDCNYTYTP
jgi:hypothetical protein